MICFRIIAVAMILFGFAAGARAQNAPPTSADAASGIDNFTLSDVQANPAAWREVDPDNLVIMNTSKGRIVLELSPQLAPQHVDRFKTYIRRGLYNDTPFNRVISGFIAQGGDIMARYGPQNMLAPMLPEFTMRRNPVALPIDPIGPDDSARQGFLRGMPIMTKPRFLAEMMQDGKVESWIVHCPGVLSTARTNDPGSANAQFFLISGDGGRQFDRLYTAKGRAISGLDVIVAIKRGPRPDGYPIDDPDRVVTAFIAADLPVDQRLRAYVQRTDTPAWREKLAAAAREGNDICSLGPVPVVIDG